MFNDTSTKATFDSVPPVVASVHMYQLSEPQPPEDLAQTKLRIARLNADRSSHNVFKHLKSF